MCIGPVAKCIVDCPRVFQPATDESLFFQQEEAHSAAPAVAASTEPALIAEDGTEYEYEEEEGHAAAGAGAASGSSASATSTGSAGAAAETTNVVSWKRVLTVTRLSL